MNIEQMADEIQAESRAKFKRWRNLIDPKVIEKIKQQRSVPRETLSKRQAQVLKLFCAGLNTKSAAAELGVTKSAITRQRLKLFEITGSKSCAQLGAWAVRNGIVE